jgi:hypothetical protein
MQAAWPIELLGDDTELTTIPRPEFLYGSLRPHGVWRTNQLAANATLSFFFGRNRLKCTFCQPATQVQENHFWGILIKVHFHLHTNTLEEVFVHLFRLRILRRRAC